MQKTIALLKQSLTSLYDSRESNAIISLLLEEVCGITRVDRIVNPDLVIDEEKSKIFEQYAARLKQGEPVQYVLGYEYFMGEKFMVNPDVLIPRPETAELINWVVDNSVENPVDNCGKQSAQPSLKLLDIGTGSGCIALSLARLINNSTVVAFDLSTGALKTAKENAKLQNINNVTFAEKDILADQNSTYEQGNVDKFDVIVSNPPYVMNKEKMGMDKNVLNHEPHLALFVPDDDPLLFYRAIANYGKLNLREGGKLYFEINSALGKETCELLFSLGYHDIELRQDMFGKDRMICARI